MQDAYWVRFLTYSTGVVSHDTEGLIGLRERSFLVVCCGLIQSCTESGILKEWCFMVCQREMGSRDVSWMGTGLLKIKIKRSKSRMAIS